MTSAHDQLFPHDNDPMRAYQRDAEETIKREAGERRQGVDASQLTTLCREVVRLNARIDRQNAEIAALRVEARQAIEDTADDVSITMGDLIGQKLRQCETKLLTEIATKFGEAIGRINALDPNEVRAKSAARANEPFRFAGGKVEPEATTGVTVADDAVEVRLPNRLPFSGSGDIH